VAGAPGTAVLVRGGAPEFVDLSVTGGEIGLGVTGDHTTRVRLVGGSVRDASTHGLLVVGAATLDADGTTVSGAPASAAESARMTLTGCTLGHAADGIVCGSTGAAVIDEGDLTGVAGTAVVGGAPRDT